MSESFESSIDRREIISQIAMGVLLVSFSMLFATLFLGYVVFRSTSPQWPPMSMENVELIFPSVSTFFVLLSSGLYWRFEKTPWQKHWLFSSFISGGLFLVSQVFLWNRFQEKGLLVSSGIFPSILNAFTWIHAAHMILGLISLSWLMSQKQVENKTLAIKNVGLFWHFLTLIWIILYIGLFVL